MREKITGTIALILIVAGLAWLVSLIPPPHARHYKVKIEKLKNGHYVYKDRKGDWWTYAKKIAKAGSDVDFDLNFDFGGDSFGRSASGSVRMPSGGSWVRGTEPKTEEIESELEVSLEETSVGEPEADTDNGADADSSGDGGSDGGGDSGGDGGGGDGGGSE